LTLPNAQRFAREPGVRIHVVAHKGNLSEVKHRAKPAPGAHRAIGQADSVFAFRALRVRPSGLWAGEEGKSLEARASLRSVFATDLRPCRTANGPVRRRRHAL
jgi:hypothetical protein